MNSALPPLYIPTARPNGPDERDELLQLLRQTVIRYAERIRQQIPVPVLETQLHLPFPDPATGADQIRVVAVPAFLREHIYAVRRAGESG